MNGPALHAPREVATDTHVIPSWMPVPGYGVLAVNAFVIRSREPVLVDTGLAALRDGFLDELGTIIDPRDLRWIWLTHVDADHTGSLAAVLDEAPAARVVTTFLGMAKMALHGLPVDRVHLLNPGQHLDTGDRKLLALRPPTYDAPETTGLFDPVSRALVSADSLGALLGEPAEDATDVSSDELAQGAITWATIDAPWLHAVEPAALSASLDAIRGLGAELVLSAHLPPARGLTNTLLANIEAARTAEPFTGPDQAALEQMMAGQQQVA